LKTQLILLSLLNFQFFFFSNEPSQQSSWNHFRSINWIVAVQFESASNRAWWFWRDSSNLKDFVAWLLEFTGICGGMQRIHMKLIMQKQSKRIAQIFFIVRFEIIIAVWRRRTYEKSNNYFGSDLFLGKVGKLEDK